MLLVLCFNVFSCDVFGCRWDKLWFAVAASMVRRHAVSDRCMGLRIPARQVGGGSQSRVAIVTSNTLARAVDVCRFRAKPGKTVQEQYK